MKKFNTEQFKINSVNPELFPPYLYSQGLVSFKGPVLHQ